MSSTLFWTIIEDGGFSPVLDGVAEPEFLSPEEITTAAGLRFAKRRSEWVLGRRVAKQLLLRCHPGLTDMPAGAITIANEPEGAPYVLADGRGRLAGSLSLSHREGMAACAWLDAAGVNVGIDIEKVEERSAAFLQDYFTPAECALFNSLPCELRSRWLTLAWSAKESVLKAWKKGLRLDTRSVEIGAAEGLERWEALPVGEWRPLAVKPLLQGAAPCRAWWQPWRNAVLTLAISGKTTIQMGDNCLQAIALA